MNEIKQQVARQFDLPFVNGGIQIPDARIEYDLRGRAIKKWTRLGHRPRRHRSSYRRLPSRPSPQQGAGRISCLRVGLRPRHIDREDRKRSPPDGTNFGAVTMTSIQFLHSSRSATQNARPCFLYLVAVHSGYFLRRQFDYFIDRNKGAMVMRFLEKARRAGHVEITGLQPRMARLSSLFPNHLPSRSATPTRRTGAGRVMRSDARAADGA